MVHMEINLIVRRGHLLLLVEMVVTNLVTLRKPWIFIELLCMTGR